MWYLSEATAQAHTWQEASDAPAPRVPTQIARASAPRSRGDHCRSPTVGAKPPGLGSGLQNLLRSYWVLSCPPDPAPSPQTPPSDRLLPLRPSYSRRPHSFISACSFPTLPASHPQTQSSDLFLPSVPSLILQTLPQRRDTSLNLSPHANPSDPFITRRPCPGTVLHSWAPSHSP